MTLPEKVEGDWDDIPKAGINYKTSLNMKMDLRRQKKAVGGYYASVSFMDAQVGKVLAALRSEPDSKTRPSSFSPATTVIIWANTISGPRSSLRDESASVPLIISVPGKNPAVCHSLVELLDLYPTLARLVRHRHPDPSAGQGHLGNARRPFAERTRAASSAWHRAERDSCFASSRWAYIQYEEDASGGIELFDTANDPKQYTNLATSADHQPLVQRLKAKLAEKLVEVRDNDL